MQMEIYYDKEKDSLQRVLDGIIVNHDEYVNGTEFIPEFGEDVESAYDLKNVPTEDIFEAYDSILLDFKGFESEEYVKGHFENARKERIRGDLILRREINAKWANKSPEDLEVTLIDNNKNYKLM